MTHRKFIADMQRRAHSYIGEAERVRREWRALSVFPFALGGGSLFALGWFARTSPLSLSIAFGVCAIVFPFVGYLTRKEGEKFALMWMDLRDDALENVRMAQADES